MLITIFIIIFVLQHNVTKFSMVHSMLYYYNIYIMLCTGLFYLDNRIPNAKTDMSKRLF